MSENWKERFFELLLMDGNKFGDAVCLKSKNMPNKLYRYRPIAKKESFEWTTESIRNGTIHCSRKIDLNDPFEMSTSLSSMDFESYLADYPSTKDVFRDFISKSYVNIDVEEILNSENWIKEIKSLPCGDVVFSLLQQAIMPELERQINDYNRISELVKIACFTEIPVNLPMWAHYADNHEGICLEYDVKGLHENLANMIFPVKYVDELLDIMKFVLAKNCIDQNQANVATYMCIQKLNDWSYEKEWRYIFLPSMKKDYLEKFPLDYFDGGEEIPFGRPSKIILGKKICPDKQRKLHDIASEFNIDIVKMKVTPYGFHEINI